MKKRTLPWKSFIIGAAAASLLVGGTYSYLTDYDAVANEFTIGKIDVDLEEPHWNPDQNKTLVPTQTIPKDPQIKNTGRNDAYVYLEVTVPTANVITVSAAGVRQPSAVTELFSYTPNNQWTLLNSVKKEKSMTYIYAFNKILKPNETTVPLFQTMTFANVIEGQLDAQTTQVPVRAYAIQTVNTGDGKESTVEQARAAFDKYLKQNQGQGGHVTQ